MATRLRSAGTPLTPVLTILAALVAGLVLGAAPAQAEDGYRFWNYSHLTGDEFAFAQTGPEGFTPEDGDVEGWRFGTSTGSQGISPRADLDAVSFGDVCGGAEQADDKKRVAVLIDYGTDADAATGDVPDPVARCAVVAADANGRQVLDAVSELRGKDTMICAIDGYPTEGCGDPVADATVPKHEQDVAFSMDGDATGDKAGDSGGGDNDWLPGSAIGIIIAMGIAAYIAQQHRKRSS